MSNYSLYGSVLIKDDSTLENFARSVIDLVPTDDIKELEDLHDLGLEEDHAFEDAFMDRVEEILEYDIVRTDIEYDRLMAKYAPEIGLFLYEFENNGGHMESIELSFFGEKAMKAFNRIITEKVWFIKFYGGDA